MSPFIKAAVVVAILSAALFASVSGQKGKGICKCGPASTEDLAVYSDLVSRLLDDMVTLTADQPVNPVSGDRAFTKTVRSASLRSGGAAATASCSAGVSCAKCLGRIRNSLKPCEASGCGGDKVPANCSLQFRQIE